MTDVRCTVPHAALLVALAAVLLAAVPVAGQDVGPHAWTPIGPPGGAPADLLLLADGSRLAVSGGALFAGDPTWRLVGAVGGPSGLSGGPVAADPADPQSLYAIDTDGTLRSSDGGATWQRLPERITLPTPARLLAVQSTQGTVLLRIAVRRADGVVERSVDRGATWRTVATGRRNVTGLEHGGEGRVLIVDGETDTVARSTDAGATFTALADLPGMDDDSVAAVAAAPSAPQRLSVITILGRTLTSVDGGSTWQEATGRLPSLFSGRLRVDPDDPELLYAHSALLFVSRDGGASWQESDLPPPVRAVLPLPGGGDRVLASTGGMLAAGLPVGGVYASDDGGRTWQPASEGLQAHRSTSLAVRPGEPSGVLTVIGGKLLHRRGGADWRQVEVPPVLEGATTDQAGPLRVGSVHVARRAPDRWAIPVETPIEAGPFGSLPNPALQLTGDGGVTWDPLPMSEVPGRMVLAPSDPDRGYLGAAPIDFRVPGPFCIQYRWEGTELDCVATSFDLEDDPAVRGGVEAVDAADADRVYTTSSRRLWRSTDGAESWTELQLPFLVRIVAAHPVVPGLVAAGGFEGELWVSDDAGSTWVQRGPVEAGEEVELLRFDPVQPRRLYALSGGAVRMSEDGGSTWTADLGAGAPSRLWVTDLVIDPADPSVLYAATSGAGVWRLHRRFPAASCVPDATTLCLGAGDRFRVRVVWQDFEHAAGYGRAVPLSAAPGDADTGAFWFFDEGNLELLVKVIDGADVNQLHWVFYGALTNVPFTLVVTDTTNGESVGYSNPARRFASRGDTAAFPETDPGTPAPPPGDAAPPLRDTVEPAPCTPSATVLCLGAGDRFRVEVTWEDFEGGSGVGTAVPATDDTGFFWFFKDSNLELAVKVLDGRSLNGRFWVFYGALTNVPFRLTVTDTMTGEQRTYVNPSRNFASRGDVAAF